MLPLNVRKSIFFFQVTYIIEATLVAVAVHIATQKFTHTYTDRGRSLAIILGGSMRTPPRGTGGHAKQQ